MRTILSSLLLCTVALAQPFVDFPTQVKRPEEIDIRTFQFTRTNGAGASGDLSVAGTGKVVTLTPCPRGVNGTDANHRIYISGGTGTAEAALITGGTCTSGLAAGGTIVVTTANTHTGTWKVASSAGGIPEALYANGSNNAIVSITESVTVYATIYAVGSNNGVTIKGTNIGANTPTILRASTFSAGDLFKNDGSSCSWYFKDLNISQNGGFVQTGAAIDFDHPTVAQYVNGVSIINGEYGIRSQGTTFLSINRGFYTQSDATIQPVAGLDITDGSINTFISDSYFGAVAPSTSNKVHYGVFIHSETFAVDGVWVSNSGFSGTIPINIVSNNAGSFLTNIMFTGSWVDGAASTGILIGGNLGTCNSLQFTGMHINMQGQNGWDATGAGVDIGLASPTVCDDIKFSGGYIIGSNTWGVVVGKTGARKISFVGTDITDNNRADTVNVGGLRTSDGVTGLTIEGARIGNTPGQGHQKNAILALGSLEATIVGNDLRTNETAPISLVGPTTGVLADNTGLNDATSFADLLSNPPDGMIVYCTDCNSTCTAGASAGSMCFREAGAWTAAGGGGSSAFSALTSSTNTTATMHVGTGASLDASGSGTVKANRTSCTGTDILLFDGTCSAMPGGSGTVTSVSFTGGLISVATPTATPALTVAGTSGGIPYFSSGSTWATSGALTANLPVIGGGAGTAPAVGSRTGNTTQFATSTGSQTANAFVKIDADGNHVAMSPAYTTQTDMATITWAIGSAAVANATVTLAGTRTLNITNPVNGGDYILNIVQDVSGNHGLTLGTGCTWKVSGGGSGAITPSTAGNAIDQLKFSFDGTFCYAVLTKNFN